MAELNESLAPVEVPAGEEAVAAVDEGTSHVDPDGDDGSYGLKPSDTNENEGWQKNSEQFDEQVGTREEATPEPVAPVAPKVQSRIQQRLDSLTAQKHEAENRAEAAEAKLEQLTEVYKQIKEPVEEEFEKYGDYVKAIAKYEAARNQINAEAVRLDMDIKAAGTADQNYQNAKMEHGKELFPDFVEAVKPLGAIFHHQSAAYRELFASPKFAEMSYYLAGNQAEAQRIAALPPSAQTREIIKLENSIEGGVTPAPIAQNLPKPTPQTRISQAPAPARQVLTGKVGSQKSVNPAKETMDQYAARRQKELEGK